MGKSYRGVGLAVVIAAAGLVWSAEAQQPASMPNFGGAGQLITYLLPSTDAKPTALTIVEPATKRIVVYHIDKTSGEITLKSARDFTGDLMLDYWNSPGISPQEIMRGKQLQQ
ncbi:hypothetical protein [Lacipirellula parvula]|uniref:Uncharacterized protein n=1 Tax=Lacipirellula parvula TaxID=2650471 RepID=A0A5K7XAV0_9BACT|nr:hypothetical protein [Lacipirellula parvula]BBO33535.1 hypothetical protein PLANPX_3147 [Lacipirellula parvula]